MTPEQISSLNTWLAVIAIASVIQVLALAAMALVGFRLYAKSREAIDNVQQQIEPVKQRVTEVLNNVNAEVARLRRVGDKVEDGVAAVSHGVGAATSAVKTAVLPGWAVTRGLVAAVSAFAKPHRNGRVEPAGHARREYEDSRFVNEGGNDARDEQLRF